MSFPQDWKRRIDYLRQRGRYEGELEEEMRFHMACKAELTGDARRARTSFGNATLYREESRAVWGWTALESIAADVRYTIRGFRNSPAFAGIAIGTLAVAIGGGTAILSLAEATLVRPLPYPNANELTLIFEGSTSQTTVRGDTSPGTFRALQESMKTLHSLALYQPYETNLTDEGEPERLDAALASANFFNSVGIQPRMLKEKKASSF